MRFPLGILTGVGFIGGGAILKRGDFVTGLTTTATLWIVTAIGLCFGGGQLIVGCAGALLGFLVLSPFKLNRAFCRRGNLSSRNVRIPAIELREPAALRNWSVRN